MKNTYVVNHINFIDKIVKNKRQEMCNIINEKLKDVNIYDALDIGSTSDEIYESSNYLIKNLNNISKYKSISDQSFKNNFFSNILTKSITQNLTRSEVDLFSSDLVISNATIEHVGNFQNQVNMIKNIVKLSKKFFIITTPNKFHPFDFHTKLPLIHWLPVSLYRKLLNLIGLKFFAKEENLNLLSENNLKLCLKNAGVIEYEIVYINLFGFKSNLLVFGKKY
jgi:hypothetical protein